MSQGTSWFTQLFVITEIACLNCVNIYSFELKRVWENTTICVSFCLGGGRFCAFRDL